MATDTPTTMANCLPAASRRSALAATAAAASPAAHPDAALIALADEATALDARYEALSEPYMDTPNGRPPEVQDQIAFCVRRGHELAEQVAGMRAATLDGLRAKARVMMIYAQKASDGALLWSGHDEVVGWSIAHDLLGLEMPATEWDAA